MDIYKRMWLLDIASGDTHIHVDGHLLCEQMVSIHVLRKRLQGPTYGSLPLRLDVGF